MFSRSSSVWQQHLVHTHSGFQEFRNSFQQQIESRLQKLVLPYCAVCSTRTVSWYLGRTIRNAQPILTPVYQALAPVLADTMLTGPSSQPNQDSQVRWDIIRAYTGCNGNTSHACGPQPWAENTSSGPVVRFSSCTRILNDQYSRLREETNLIQLPSSYSSSTHMPSTNSGTRRNRGVPASGIPPS